MRSCQGGEKLVACTVWAGAGDLIDAVTQGRVFPIKHPDTMSQGELQVRAHTLCMHTHYSHNTHAYVYVFVYLSYQEAYERFLPDVTAQGRTPEALIQAVADKDGVPAELLRILLMYEHLYGCLCKTIWSDKESWEEYVERVRVYDPTAASFKRIHFALLFGHGLQSTSTSESETKKYRMRPTPSQQNLVHGQAVPLRRLSTAGLRMINVNEGHLEHRHMIRKALINLNCLHQIARSIGKGKDVDQDKMTRDKIRRGKNLMQQQKLQSTKMWFKAKEAFQKDTWASRYRRQVVYLFPRCAVNFSLWSCARVHDSTSTTAWTMRGPRQRVWTKT